MQADAARAAVLRQLVGRIAHQIDDHLLDQHRVGQHLGQRLVQRPFQGDVLALQIAPQQLDGSTQRGGQVAGFALRAAAGQELADALHDAPGLARLLALALQRAQHRCVVEAGLLQRAQDAAVVAGDRGQRLVELVRQRGGDLAQRGQAGLVRHGLGLMAFALLQALALGDVDDRTHPADLPAAGVDQRRLEHHHVEGVAVAVAPARLIALARRQARKVAAVALLSLSDLVGRPVGHRRQAPDELLGWQPDHLAEGAVDVEQPALDIACAKRHQRRVLHRAAPAGFGAPGGFGARDLPHLAAQQPGGDGNQQQEAAGQHQRQLGQLRGAAFAQDQLQEGTGHAITDQHTVADMGVVEVDAGFVGPDCGEHGTGRIDQPHDVLAGEPPGRVALEQHRRRVAHHQAFGSAAIEAVEPFGLGLRRGTDSDDQVRRQPFPVVLHRGPALRQAVVHLGDDAVAGVEPGHADPQSPETRGNAWVRLQHVLTVWPPRELRGQRAQVSVFQIDAATQLSLQAERVGHQRALLLGAFVTFALRSPQHDPDREQHRQQHRQRPESLAPCGGRATARRLSAMRHKGFGLGAGRDGGHRARIVTMHGRHKNQCKPCAQSALAAWICPSLIGMWKSTVSRNDRKFHTGAALCLPRCAALPRFHPT